MTKQYTLSTQARQDLKDIKPRPWDVISVAPDYQSYWKPKIESLIGVQKETEAPTKLQTCILKAIKQAENQEKTTKNKTKLIGENNQKCLPKSQGSNSDKNMEDLGNTQIMKK
jgi:hypothetical protein